MIVKTFVLLLAGFLSFPQVARGAIKSFSANVVGPDVRTGEAISPSLTGRKGLVAVFLSAVCPCSNSHLRELSALSKEYPDYVFIGIHSNTDEKKQSTQNYFETANLPFPVIQDNGAKIADEFKAYKTPHAFIMKSNGEIVYQGGVSSSHDFENADRKYLREALEDLAKDRPVRTKLGRTLGCVISRGGNNVW